jgi:carbon monoxide dehydrogenase subunit G
VKVEGTRSFAAPRDRVWEVLNDPRRMAQLMPGVESFDIHDDRHWRANVKVPLGLGSLPLRFDFEKTDERTLEFARLHAKGNGVGAIVSLDTQFHLADAGGGTEMRWEADVRIAGPVGSMGQRVLQPIVNQQVSQVLSALERQVSAAASEGEPDAPEAPAPAEGGEGVTGGAEEGTHPASPETYEPEPEGPTHSTGS